MFKVRLRPFSTTNKTPSFYSPSNYNPNYRNAIDKQHIIKSEKEFRFAIVGSGPAGFYMAKNL